MIQSGVLLWEWRRIPSRRALRRAVLVRGRSDYLTDRYSERVEIAEDVSRRVNQRSM